MEFLEFFRPIAQKQMLRPKHEGSRVTYTMDFGHGDYIHARWNDASKGDIALGAIIYAPETKQSYLEFNRTCVRRMDGGLIPMGEGCYHLIWRLDGLDKSDMGWREDIREFVVMARHARKYLCPSYAS